MIELKLNTDPWFDLWIDSDEHQKPSGGLEGMAMYYVKLCKETLDIDVSVKVLITTSTIDFTFKSEEEMLMFRMKYEN